MKWILRTALACAAVLIGFVVFAVLASTKDRGPGEVVPGYRTFSVPAPHRGEELGVAVWYPTTGNGDSRLIGQTALFYGQHVVSDLPDPTGIYPMVVFSHGSGGNALQIAWLAEALVAQGYVVVAAHHPGTTSRDSLPARTVMIWERARDMTVLLDWMATNPIPSLVADTDVSRAFFGWWAAHSGPRPKLNSDTREAFFDWWATQPKPRLVVDTDNVVAMGFSLGGHTALAVSGMELSKDAFIDYCSRNAGAWDCGWLERGGVDLTEIDRDLYEASYRDPRVVAAVAVDPALAQAMTPASAARMDIPALIVNFEPEAGIPEALDSAAIAGRIDGARYRRIRDTWHFAFLPECSLLGTVIIGLSGEENICSDGGGRPRADVHAEIADLILDFIRDEVPSGP